MDSTSWAPYVAGGQHASLAHVLKHTPAQLDKVPLIQCFYMEARALSLKTTINLRCVHIESLDE